MQTKFLAFVMLAMSFTVSSYAQRLNDNQVRNYIEKYKILAISEQQRTGIPAAITLAQGIHETGAGTSQLATNANNHFGLKCKSGWAGQTYYYTDNSPNECFRKYSSDFESYLDHSNYLMGNPRYTSLFQILPGDYAGWASGLRRAGYATNPKYAQELIGIIERYQLQQYTLAAMGQSDAGQQQYAGTTTTAQQTAPEPATTNNSYSAPQPTQQQQPERQNYNGWNTRKPASAKNNRQKNVTQNTAPVTQGAATEAVAYTPTYTPATKKSTEPNVGWGLGKEPKKKEKDPKLPSLNESNLAGTAPFSTPPVHFKSNDQLNRERFFGNAQEEETDNRQDYSGELYGYPQQQGPSYSGGQQNQHRQNYNTQQYNTQQYNNSQPQYYSNAGQQQYNANQQQYGYNNGYQNNGYQNNNYQSNNYQNNGYQNNNQQQYNNYQNGSYQNNGYRNNNQSHGAQQPNGNLTASIGAATMVKINDLKAVYAKKGENPLAYATKFGIRYKKFLEINDLEDEPLYTDMPLYIERKHFWGQRPMHLVKPGETLHLISQREGIQMKYLREMNFLEAGEEPIPGIVIELQTQAKEKPKVKAAEKKKKTEPAYSQNDQQQYNNQQPVQTQAANNAYSSYQATTNNSYSAPQPTQNRGWDARRSASTTQNNTQQTQYAQQPTQYNTQAAQNNYTSNTSQYSTPARQQSANPRYVPPKAGYNNNNTQVEEVNHNPRYVAGNNTQTTNSSNNNQQQNNYQYGNVPQQQAQQQPPGWGAPKSNPRYVAQTTQPAQQQQEPEQQLTAKEERQLRKEARRAEREARKNPPPPVQQATPPPKPKDELDLLKEQFDNVIYSDNAPKQSNNYNSNRQQQYNNQQPVQQQQYYAQQSQQKGRNVQQRQNNYDPAKYYRVKQGDTAFLIAKQHQISIHQLMEWNDLNFDTIKVGQTLRVKP